MKFQIPENKYLTRSYKIEEHHTAEHVGSGSMKVLATPVLAGFMEEVSRDTVQKLLPEGWTTVGYRLEINHKKPSFIGEKIEVKAVITKSKDRKLVFTLSADNGKEIVGDGKHKRLIVNENDFLKSKN